MPKNNRTSNNNTALQNKTLHVNLGFAASEAYKLLRTNLMFALPNDGDKKCRIIGITSSVRGEGKSTTAMNISYTLAEVDKKVLLIEADMRLPNIAKRMELKASPGLSNILISSGGDVSDYLQQSGIFNNWRIMTAGDLPPNPNELLGSRQMQSVLKAFSTVFDYIIVDLPPVNVVSDALVISPLLDGIIVVVRENYSEKKELRACLRQLSMANAKVLGIHMNAVKESHKRYGKSNKYYKYYKSERQE